MIQQIRRITNMLPHPVRFGMRGVLYYGRQQTCILCGHHVRTFLSHGGGAPVLQDRKVVGGMKRDEDRCPVCHGRDRTRLMMLYIQTQTQINKVPIRVLHVAPDFGLYLWLKRQQSVEYVGTDLDASRYRHIDNMQSADLTATPFADNSFDIIICSHVLEHVPDDKAAFAEIFRILKPAGHALLLTPFAVDGNGTDEDASVQQPEARNLRFGQWDHVRLYDRSDFLTRMQRSGMTVSLFDPFKSQPQRAPKLHLNPLELLPIGRKPAYN